MCVCDLGFKCVCAIWEGYILNPPARGWSSTSRRPLPMSIRRRRRRRPVQRPLTWSPGHLVTWSTSGHLVIWSPVRLVTLSPVRLVTWSTSGQRLVTLSPCHLVAWSSSVRPVSSSSRHHLAAASLRAHLLRDPAFPIHPRHLSLSPVNLCLFCCVVAILTFCL